MKFWNTIRTRVRRLFFDDKYREPTKLMQVLMWIGVALAVLLALALLASFYALPIVIVMWAFKGLFL